MHPKFKELFLEKLAEKWWEALEDGSLPEAALIWAAREAHQEVKEEQECHKTGTFWNCDTCKTPLMIVEHLSPHPPEKEQPRWRAEKSEIYYFISGTGEISCQKDMRSKVDDAMISFGNYFHTREAAEKKLEEIKKLLKS